jgi:hypothetical protein
MTVDEETAIRAWLEHINERDPDEITEVLTACNSDTEARAYFLRRAEEVPPTPAPDYWATCGACWHFHRIEHLNLGHCAKGAPEALAGLWDNVRRYCEQYQARTQKGGE